MLDDASVSSFGSPGGFARTHLAQMLLPGHVALGFVSAALVATLADGHKVAGMMESILSTVEHQEVFDLELAPLLAVGARFPELNAYSPPDCLAEADPGVER